MSSRSAIAQLAPRTDVIAIVRGGGASSDLHVWNHENVVTTIARCNTPIVVGVGHISPAPIRPTRTTRNVAIAVLMLVALEIAYWVGLRT